MRERMTTVSLRRGAITVDCAPAGLKDLLRYWKKELFSGKKNPIRKMGGHYENLYTAQGSTVTTLPGFGHKILEFLRKTDCPFEVKDFRLPLPKPNFEKACQGLYDHQIEPVITALLAGGGIVSLPTGFGKTVCAGAIIRAFDPEELKLRGTPRIIFAAPDKDINQKNFEAFERLFPDREVGLVMSGKRKFSDDIQVITLDSLHLIDPSEVGILIVDEVHSAASTDRSTSISTFHNAARWGVSATPTGRFDGGDVLNEGLFGPVVVQKTYQDAVKLGALVPIEVYWVKAPKPHIGMQYYLQYKQRDSKIRSAIVANPDYSQLVAGLMHRIPDSMSVICFTQWVKQMANIHALCPDISYVHAQTNEGVGTIHPIKPKERKEIYDKMVSGEIKKIFATHVYKQGVDFPSLDIVINASAGGSDITAKQIPGRASRKADGKDKAYVIDFTHDWDWYEHNGTRKPGPLMASDLARRRSYRDLGFNQTVVESIDELPFLKNTI